MMVPADALRAAFARAMSDMYRVEVPLYGTLVEIVEQVNRTALTGRPPPPEEVARLGAERHGAIRLGTAAELALLRRAFAVLGMHPVGYYDLAASGIPVHSTAFRPIDPAALACNPFRLFTSLLRIDLIEPADLREQAAELLGRRRIVSERGMALIEQGESSGGLNEADGAAFVAELVETFRWHRQALVDEATYRRLLAAHPLVADIVAFKGPHINHLTPRTLDIDAVQAEMRRRDIPAKAVIEGPPPRRVPILLRQTSFRALEEPVAFAGAISGTHTARFGEIEQRGLALTPNGRALYDRLLTEAGPDPEQLAATFQAFPDDLETLRSEGLGYFRYRHGEDGTTQAEPITYEDFLPVSAAGIFRSNLTGEDAGPLEAGGAQESFEAALGTKVLDPFALYAAAEQASLAALDGAAG